MHSKDLPGSSVHGGVFHAQSHPLNGTQGPSCWRLVSFTELLFQRQAILQDSLWTISIPSSSASHARTCGTYCSVLTTHLVAAVILICPACAGGQRGRTSHGET